MQHSLMTKCVHMNLYEYAVDKREAIEKGLDYMLYFRANCTKDLDLTKVNDFGCAVEQMDALGIDEVMVTKCYSNSFASYADSNTENMLLEEDANL